MCRNGLRSRNCIFQVREGREAQLSRGISCVRQAISLPAGDSVMWDWYFLALSTPGTRFKTRMM